MRPRRLARWGLAALIAAAGCASGPPPTTAVRGGAAPAATAIPSPTPRSTAAAEPLPFDPAVTRGRLANGLTIYLRHNDEPRQRVELRLVVNAGSVLEDDDQLGLAHFIEHMAFNGTEHFPKRELVGYLESMGVRFGPDLNASTSFDETIYRLEVPTDDPTRIATALEVLADWAHAITFDPDEVDRERGVVIEEWREGRGARARIFDRQAPVLFAGSRYAERLPIGSEQGLASFTREALVRFYHDWYRPDLMAVVVVGDVDPGRARALIERAFGDIPGPRDPRPRPVYEVPDHERTLYAIATDSEATLTRVGLTRKLPRRPMGTVADYRRAIVERLYDGMLNERLVERTREPDPPFLLATSGVGSLVRSKDAYTLGAVVAEGELARGLEALATEAERVRRHGFAASELKREKAVLARAMEQWYRERDTQKSASLAAACVREYLSGEAEPGVVAEVELGTRLLPGITLEEVNALAVEWLAPHDRVITASAPAKEGLEPPSEAVISGVLERVSARQIAPYEDRVATTPLLAAEPEPGLILEESTIPELGVTQWRLANGVRVVLKPTDFKKDQIVFTAFSPGGTSLTADADYVAAMTAASLIIQSGVGDLDLTRLHKLLADKAVSVRPYISELEEGFKGAASPEDAELLFQLIYLYATAPRASEEAFASVKQRQLGLIENRLARPDTEFWDTTTRLLTQDHPRRRPWTTEMIDEMDLGRSFEIYQDRFADLSDFTFVFVGSFQLDDLRPLVRRYLATLPATGRREQWRDVGVSAPDGAIEETVSRGLEPRSEVAIVFTHDLDWNRRNRFTVGAMAAVLRIRLRERLREDEGGTYGVAVRASADRFPRSETRLGISFSCDPARVHELTDAVFRDIRALQEQGPSAATLTKVQEQQRRSREVQLRENSFWVGSLAWHLWHGEDPRQILDFDDLVDGLTPAAVREAAVRWIDLDRHVQVVLMPDRETTADEPSPVP